MEIRKIRQLAKLLKAEGLSELELQVGESYLRIKKDKEKKREVFIETTVNSELEEKESEPVQETIPEGELVTSPLAGTFYRASAPGAAPFVSVGDSISKGQTMCILEAMKLMNELEAEKNCKILEILVKDSDSISEGQPLFRIETSE